MNKQEWKIFNQLSVSMIGPAQMAKAQGRVFDVEKSAFEMAHSFIVARRKFIKNLSDVEQKNIDLFDNEEPLEQLNNFARQIIRAVQRQEKKNDEK